MLLATTKLIKKYRAEIGIGTLIVFIASLLTAAIAAGVIIRTSGVLQEKSYAVAGQARKRLVTGVEITEVYGNANLTAVRVPQLEISLRLRPGAQEVNLRQMGLTFSTESYSIGSTLQHSTASKYNEKLNGVPLKNTSWYSLSSDLNSDGQIDYLKIDLNYGASHDAFLFNISGVGIANVSLGKYIYNATLSAQVRVVLNEKKIVYDEDVYGFITADFNVTSGGNITVSANQVLYFDQFPSQDICTFDRLIPERFFCYIVKLGDHDTILEPGESLVLYYKFKNKNALREDEEFQLSFVPKDGAITYLYGQVPGVVRKQKILIWPT
ncbi:MAG: hypothetical protein QW594_00940 [Candidatus Woesearchaeota archaeon]